MSFKTILAVIGVDELIGDVLSAAELSTRQEAHLIVLVTSCLPPSPFGDVTGASYAAWATAMEAEDQRVQARADEIRTLLMAKGFEADVELLFCLRSTVDQEVARRARYVDLTVIGNELATDGYLFRQVLDGALFQSPAPVLLIKAGKPVDLSPRIVQIAWNSSLEAARAVRQAMPMLLAAEEVHVVLVDPIATSDAMGEEPGADIATYLARHGVKTIVDVIPAGGRDPADVLRQQAIDINAEMRVMGGYGHSRMRERMFGGVTRSMTEKPEIPVFMAR